MVSVTRWNDNKCGKIKNIINTITNTKHSYDSERMLFKDIETRLILKKNKIINIENKRIEFNIIRYNYNQINKDNSRNPLPVEERTIKKSGYVVVYTDSKDSKSIVNYIINRNFDALKILRVLLNYSGKGEISKEQPVLKSDMFIWLIKRIYCKENKIKLKEKNKILKIDNLTEFRGQTEDATNIVSANGETIMNILSTLSFLLESNNMRQIKFSLAYEDHENIELTFSKNIIGTNVKSYSGSFEDDNIHLDKEDRDLVIESEIYLLCYLIILPNIINVYTKEIEEENWSLEIHKNFLEKVATDLQKKIKNKITKLTQ